MLYFLCVASIFHTSCKYKYEPKSQGFLRIPSAVFFIFFYLRQTHFIKYTRETMYMLIGTVLLVISPEGEI